MKSHLPALPTELIQYVASYLEPCDLGALRLTSRAVDSAVSQSRQFCSLFTRKNIQLSAERLQKFVQVTSQGRMGCLLQHCTIAGQAQEAALTDDEDELADETQTLRLLLATAFSNVKQHSPHKGLTSLCLGVAACTTDENGRRIEAPRFHLFRQIWDAARQTFEITLAALNDSQLHVYQELDVFMSLRGCSLAYNDFLDLPQRFASLHALESLKRIRLSLSAPHEVRPEYRFESEDGQASADEPTEAPATEVYPENILQSVMLVMAHFMPQLEAIELHWYNVAVHLRDLPTPPPVPLSPALDGETKQQRFAHLKECHLSGLYVSESDLLRFLTATRPPTVALTYVHLLRGGAWTSIFEFISGINSPVTKYLLDDLTQSRIMVHFDGPGNPKFPLLNREPWPHTLTRQDSSAIVEIRHRLASGRVLGSPQRTRWIRSRREEYGPLQRPYDFVELNMPPPVVTGSSGSDSHDD